MLYELLFPLADRHIIFNVFQYISFRAAGAMVTALLVSFVAGPYVIRRLERNRVGQVIRVEGPKSHLRKAGTPTMGGVIMLIAMVVSTLLWAKIADPYMNIALGMTLGATTAMAQDVIYKKHTVVDFGDDTIDGNLSKPDGAYLESRKHQTHLKLIKVRESFRAEILQSVRSL
mgnify:CR=1 FL=1